SGRGDAKVAVKALATSQGIATMVLQNLREFHDKAEAHNASIQGPFDVLVRDIVQTIRAQFTAEAGAISNLHRVMEAFLVDLLDTARRHAHRPPIHYGDLGPPPSLAPGKSLLDGSLTALEPKIQSLSGMSSESIKGATAPATTMGLEKDTSSVALLDEDIVMETSTPSMETEVKPTSGSMNIGPFLKKTLRRLTPGLTPEIKPTPNSTNVVVVAPAASPATDEDDVMDDWTVLEEDAETADA
ncbi:MAG: hypothetical protein ALECFALPRED_009861, partial [Alectoria fallacina]